MSSKPLSLPRVICVVGPTSSGKTALGLALAKVCSGVVINADARQLYTGFDIGTGKPQGEWGVWNTEKALMVEGVAHVLFAEDPHVAHSMMSWKARALACINRITAEGKTPIVVGGTGLYIAALCDGLEPASAAVDAARRAELNRWSLDQLVRRLDELDASARAHIDVRNPRRLIRAIELMEANGAPLAATRTKSAPQVHALKIGCKRERAELFARADMAIDEMLRRGWLEEVRALCAQGFETCDAMTAIGYRELASVLRDEISLEDAMQRIRTLTHAYIRRQETWFKRDTDIQWVSSTQEAQSWVSTFFGRTVSE